MRNTILFQHTHDPTYADKRKALSGVFFKSKLVGMTKIIKQVTLSEIKKIQKSGASTIELEKMTLNLQSQIIINISVGTKHASAMVDYEEDNGQISNLPLAEALDRIITVNVKRTLKFVHIAYPEFSGYDYWPGDWRQTRNLKTFRAALQKIIDERRSSKTNDEDDLLTILTTTEFFTGDDNLIIDEIITFFFAGMKTIQISTANLIYYLTKHTDIKKKLLAEILPPVEAVKDNNLDKLDYDTVMEFEYLQQCYNECLRIEPPTAGSIS